MAACSQPEKTPDPAAVTPELISATEGPLLESTATQTVVPTHGAIPTTMTPLPTVSSANGSEQAFLPLIPQQPPTATPTPIPPTPIPPTPTPPPIDFTAVAEQLATEGKGVGFVKVGFHVGVGGNAEGLEEWMRALDAAGVPFFLKSVDNAQPILLGQQLMRESGVPHTLVFRKSSGGSYNWDVPNYSLPPVDAAQIHWEAHRNAFPPELDPSLVWLETINEVDKNEAEWLGQFALKTAELALNEGFNWAAFGWSSGEPEPEHWQTPSMLAFLQLASQHPQRLAISLHEYSYIREDIADAYPYKIGRFQTLFQIADANNIPRPTVLITEWGWTYETVPQPEQALQDVAWAAKLYAPHPEIKGAAIWYLGNGFARIADQTQRLIRPLTYYTLRNYFEVPLPPEKVPIEPERYAPEG